MKLNALLKKPLWLYAAVSALAVLTMALASAVWAPQLQQWEERLASRSWSLANSQATERRVVVVDIDEKSTQALGPWPWPRERVATLLTSLNAYGVNLKVVDVLFDGAQDPVQDQKLVQALQSGAPTVISQLFALSPQAQVKSGQLAGALGACPASNTASSNFANNATNAPQGTPAYGFMAADAMFAQSSGAVGHITPVVDADGSIRRVPAVVCFEGQAYPALAVAGFGFDNLTVTKDKKTLIIEGHHSRDTVNNEDSTAKYLHKGISERSFRREFQLADYVEISNAHLELGILSVHLKREVPEQDKPKTIAITYKE